MDNPIICYFRNTNSKTEKDQVKYTGQMTPGRIEIVLEKRIHNKNCNWFYQRIWSGYCIHGARKSCYGQRVNHSTRNPCKLKKVIDFFFEKKKKVTSDEMRDWIKGLITLKCKWTIWKESSKKLVEYRTKKQKFKKKKLWKKSRE